MRILGFARYIENNHTTAKILNDTEVVIDGQNFFYELYQESDLPFEFGCESDRYAQYVRKKLNVFKKANVNCYIIFKGGHKNISSKFRRNNTPEGKDFVIGGENHGIVLPIFMKDVYKQVLDELKLNYVVCEFEAKKDCIAFAQKRNCPIISYDIEFCFSGEPYIPVSTLKFDDKNNILQCEVFHLNKFIDYYKGLSIEKLATFIVLADQNMFPEMFRRFFQYVGINCKGLKFIKMLLHHLSRCNNDQSTQQIFKFLDHQSRIIFLKAKEKIQGTINVLVEGGVPQEYLDNNKTIEIIKNDPNWFAKGVALNYVAIPYINIYRSNVLQGSWAIANNEADDALLVSTQIIQYAYDLLTDFQNNGLLLLSDCKMPEDLPVTDKGLQISDVSIKKPIYVANESIFENGWSRIRSIGLFEHFLTSTMPEVDLKDLEMLPKDAELLVVALVYYSLMKHVNTTNEVYSILLSYVMLNIVFLTCEENLQDDNSKENKKKIVTKNDCAIAAEIMSEYFETTKSEIKSILDKEVIHPLVEFQHVLQHMNYLNKLCGSSFQPTIYSRTYNGTFVYKILYTMKNESLNRSGLEFIKQKLKKAPTVLSVFLELVNSYKILVEMGRLVGKSTIRNLS